MLHEIWIYTLDDRLGLAPPCDHNAKVGRVLDVGTGTGIWALDFGEEHPETEVSRPDDKLVMFLLWETWPTHLMSKQVLGVDLSHTLPTL